MLPLFFLILIFFNTSSAICQLSRPLLNAHAHNDYEKSWPALTEALKNGFVSIEIDVFPYRNKLKVAHIDFFLGIAPDLEDLYFKPLQQFIDKHDQLFTDSDQRLIFMIDIKKNASLSYALLRKLCQKYKHLVTHYYPSQDSLVLGKLDILLSGHKPYQEVINDSVRYMLIDGSLSVIGDSVINAAIAPRVSARYHSMFKWSGNGDMTEDENQKLKNIVTKAHNNGRKLRFWALPENEVVWGKMLDEGVDWINVDHLSRFRKFYLAYVSKNK